MSSTQTDLRERLENLAESGERDHPLVFVGRENIVGRIIRATRILPPRGGKGKTFVIEGAPGAGKTALITEVAKQLRGRGVGTIECTEIPNGARVEGIWRELGGALAGASPDEARTTQYSETHGGLGVGRSGVDHTRGRSIAPRAVSNPEDVLALRGRKSFGDEAAVVFIDEVQNIAEGTEASELVRTLHTQAVIPVLLVCAGLSGSRDQLGKAGKLSRLNTDNRIQLGGLTNKETLDGARRSLEVVRHWGVRASNAVLNAWAKRIAEASDNWPRHLQCYLNAVWKTLVDQETPNLDMASLDAAIAAGNTARQAYYSERLRMARVPIEVAGALHQRLAQGGRSISDRQASVLVESAIENIQNEWDKELCRKEFPNVGDCFNTLLRTGLVSLDGDYCVSPIPTMTDHILGKLSAENAPQREAASTAELLEH